MVAKLNKVRVWPIGIHGLVKKFRSFLRAFTGHIFFENLMTICVLLNTFAMALDRYGMERDKPETYALLNTMNNIFTWIFIGEMGLKLLALGPSKYC